MDKEQKEEMVYNFNMKGRKQHSHVEVVEHRLDWNKPQEVIYLINWSAIGSVNVKITKQFIKHLQEAIIMCNKLNR